MAASADAGTQTPTVPSTGVLRMATPSSAGSSAGSSAATGPSRPTAEP